MRLQPLLKSPCLETLRAWSSEGTSLDTRYKDGLDAVAEWTALELEDEPFDSMDEGRQRRIDSWGFSLRKNCGDEDKSFAAGEWDEGGILCAELVTKLGGESGDDSRSVAAHLGRQDFHCQHRFTS